MFYITLLKPRHKDTDFQCTFCISASAHSLHKRGDVVTLNHDQFEVLDYCNLALVDGSLYKQQRQRFDKWLSDWQSVHPIAEIEILRQLINNQPTWEIR